MILRVFLALLACLLTLAAPVSAHTPISHCTFVPPPVALFSEQPSNEQDCGPLTLHLDGLHDRAGPCGGVLVRQNPWTSFDPEGLSATGDYFREMGNYWKGIGDVTIGAMAATAQAVRSLPVNTIGVFTETRELAQMDGSSAWQGVKSQAAIIGQGARQAMSNYGDRLKDGDCRAWGQVVGTALTLGGAKGAQFAKAAEVAEVAELAEVGEVTTSATRIAVKTEQAVAEATKTTVQNSAELGRNMAREGRPVEAGDAAAHIVPSTGTKGHWAKVAESRALLERYGVNISDAANGARLGHPRPHNQTHTGAFQNSTNARLNRVRDSMQEAGRGGKAIRKALRQELRSIGRELEGR